ncbi:MAG: putative zinc-binding metallopeptidase [Porphyromonadaceae bacterium]|nr:putative zinc-binding metallopeptidase [Porphyromonadaceae bacterium]
MNKIMKRALALAFCVLGVLSVGSCAKGDDPDPTKSVIVPREFEPTVFDQWLSRNYVDAYNIDFKYKMQDTEADPNYNLVPPSLENSMKMAKLVRHAWIGAYDEVAGIEFMRLMAPRALLLVGSSGRNNDGSELLGTAEGGVRVTLYKVNEVNVNDPGHLNLYYFHTMHHEFGHILHQNKLWPTEYNDISRGDYLASTFFQPDNNKISIYAPKGFVTAYSRKNSEEDFTEVTACYITYTDEQWRQIFEAAGEEGRAKLDKKIKIVKDYMKDAWNIDMDELRAVVTRRTEEIRQSEFKLIEPEWLPLLDNSNFRAVPAIGTPHEERMRSAVLNWVLASPRLLEDRKGGMLGSYGCSLMTQHYSHPHNH